MAATKHQRMGCLPAGFTLDSMLLPEEFCRWQRVSADWFASHRALLPGVRQTTRKVVRIHPRSFLEKSN